jgi:hypothetical protein
VDSKGTDLCQRSKRQGSRTDTPALDSDFLASRRPSLLLLPSKPLRAYVRWRVESGRMEYTPTST